jgi:beta-lactamase class A
MRKRGLVGSVVALALASAVAACAAPGANPAASAAEVGTPLVSVTSSPAGDVGTMDTPSAAPASSAGSSPTSADVGPAAGTAAWTRRSVVLYRAAGGTGPAQVHLGPNFALTLSSGRASIGGVPWYEVAWVTPGRRGTGWLPASSVMLHRGTAVASAGIDALDAGLAAYLANLGPRVGVAVTDVTRGVRYTYNAGRAYVTASSMKVPIMLALLSQLEARGRRPTARERSLLRTMIENSNNASASALYAEIGNQGGIAAFMRQVGVSGLRPSSPARGWGWSTITPRAMATLLERLHAGTILTAKDRALALGLMENVQASQRWGVGDTRPAGANVALKNGWTAGPDGLWVANSSGIVTAGDEVYVIAVYTTANRTVAEGKRIVSHVCEAIGKRLVH